MVLQRPRRFAWRPVPGARTGATPAPIAFADTLHLFLLDDQERVTWNRFSQRGGWSEWRRVPGEVAFGAAPFAVEFRGQLHLFSLGKDGRLYQNSLLDDRWDEWRPLPVEVAAASGPRAAVWQGQLLLFLWDESGQLLHQRYDSECAPPSRVVQAIAGAQPSSSPHPIAWGGQLHLFLTGPDRQLRSCSRPPGEAWSTPQVLPETKPTLGAAWATRFRSTLVLGATTERGQLLLTRRQPLSGWHGWQGVSDVGFTGHGPSLCAFAGRIYIFALTEDGSVYLTTTR